jgi:hypothetical protein
VARDHRATCRPQPRHHHLRQRHRNEPGADRHHQAAALQQVAAFDKFTGDNDPHGEHDFGAFDLCGRKFFWKLDYFDERMELGSEDPSDPKKTTRVLTLMLASEY